MALVDLEQYYQKIKALNISHYAGEVPYYSKAHLRVVEITLLKKLPPGAVILDVGCGSGRFSIGAAEQGFKVTGLDITPAAIEASRQRAKELGLNNICFLVCDMIALPFEDEAFDYVFCPRFSLNAVPTFKHRQQAIQEMIRVVKSDGKVFIESFNNFYVGRGSLVLVKNLLRDCKRHFAIFVCYLTQKPYDGLLPGDIVYPNNKVPGAPDGYAHLPSVFELVRSIPHGVTHKFSSFYELTNKIRKDWFKFFRYSIWITLEKIS